MRPASLLLLVCSALFAQDARQIVLQSLNRDKEMERLTRMYTFVQRDELRELDSGGKPTKIDSKTNDVTLLEGTPYYRLIARNDKPLSPSEAKKEEEKLRKSIEERRKETPEQRRKRQERWEQKRASQHEGVREIPDAYHLKVVGKEMVDGREAWVIDATPRPGFRAKTRMGRFFPKCKGRIWITTADSAWVKVEAETIDTISFGWLVGRLTKGAHLSFEQTRVNDEVWLPKRLEFTGSARLMLVKGLRAKLTATFQDYKKFQTDSRLVSYEAR